MLFVKYRLMESFRHAKKSDGHVIPVYPYVRITYAVSQIHLNVVSSLIVYMFPENNPASYLPIFS